MDWLFRFEKFDYSEPVSITTESENFWLIKLYKTVEIIWPYHYLLSYENLRGRWTINCPSNLIEELQVSSHAVSTF